MTVFDPCEAALTSNAPQLAKLVNPGAGEQAGWLAEDLPDLLRHQWLAPVDFDLAEVRSKDRQKTLTQAAASNIRTFGDLLCQASPSLALLKLAKAFFKDKAGRSKDRSPPEQVGYLFYVLVILAAKVRLGTSISSLSEAEVRKAAKWAHGQTWVEGEPRNLLRQLAPDGLS